jgi:hypothetical protein
MHDGASLSWNQDRTLLGLAHECSVFLIASGRARSF